ncbi:MAG: STAS-like domain-containing protein [Bacilli bacterium]|nr:STAS-like domain-containing protein [Bacilli bacterium]
MNLREFKELEPLELNKMISVKRITGILHNAYINRTKKVNLIIANTHVYPNTCTPLSGIIDFYKERGVKTNLIFLEGESYYGTRLNLLEPFSVEDENNNQKLDDPFNKIWTFETPGGETKLVSALLSSLRRTELCGEGTFRGLEWCLNETMDNVLVHSNSGKGFVMAQYHQSNKLFSVCIYDNGIGIFNSFLNSKHHPKKPLDAITLALGEKITRDEKVGQGNGLWGLYRIVEENKGKLRIISDGAYYEMRFERGNPKQTNIDDWNKNNLISGLGTTIIDFQLSVDNDMDIEKAIPDSNLIDVWEENLENSNGDHILKISELSKGTGTRPAALEMRNIALNLAIHNNNKVIFDFEGIGTLSSSYADELIGKLISDYGIVFFNRKFDIINLNKTNLIILERSVKMRLAQSYYDEKINEDE